MNLSIFATLSTQPVEVIVSANDRSPRFKLILNEGNMKEDYAGKMCVFCASSSLAQEVGDEKNQNYAQNSDSC